MSIIGIKPQLFVFNFWKKKISIFNPLNPTICCYTLLLFRDRNVDFVFKNLSFNWITTNSAEYRLSSTISLIYEHARSISNTYSTECTFNVSSEWTLGAWRCIRIHYLNMSREILKKNFPSLHNFVGKPTIVERTRVFFIIIKDARKPDSTRYTACNKDIGPVSYGHVRRTRSRRRARKTWHDL